MRENFPWVAIFPSFHSKIKIIFSNPFGVIIFFFIFSILENIQYYKASRKLHYEIKNLSFYYSSFFIFHQTYKKNKIKKDSFHQTLLKNNLTNKLVLRIM